MYNYFNKSGVWEKNENTQFHITLFTDSIHHFILFYWIKDSSNSRMLTIFRSFTHMTSYNPIIILYFLLLPLSDFFPPPPLETTSLFSISHIIFLYILCIYYFIYYIIYIHFIYFICFYILQSWYRRCMGKGRQQTWIVCMGWAFLFMLFYPNNFNNYYSFVYLSKEPPCFLSHKIPKLRVKQIK